MKIYLVGGAIRDQLLGLTPNERDWVVVGATPQTMLDQGYQAVGKDFPVFLHPETHEEYALARTERKTGKGYKGFAFHASPEVTLEEDLKRRDLTINAIAQDKAGQLIDPYRGQQDLKDKLFRHVSPAFQEDPVRILRLARFATRFPDFHCHPDTLKLMHAMVQNGEINALVAERVWQELDRALSNEKPIRFFQTLQACDALSVLFPGLSLESTGCQALEQSTHLTNSAIIRFAALLHHLEESEIKALCSRYRAPKEYSDLALLVSRQLHAYQKIKTSNAETVLDFILAVDVLRRPERFADFSLTCQACGSTRPEQKEWLLNLAESIKAIDTTPLQAKNLKGEDFAKALHALRLDVVQQAR